jgi:hypothetical protein
VSVIAALGLFYSAPDSAEDIFHICAVSCYSVYLFVFVSYVIFKVKYSTVQRSFTNPLGIASAVFGSSVFILSLIGLVSMNNFDHSVIYCGLVIVLTIYYYFYGYKVQKFSEEEQKHLFKAYVINANSQKRGSRPGARPKVGSNKNSSSKQLSLSSKNSNSRTIAAGSSKNLSVKSLLSSKSQIAPLESFSVDEAVGSADAATTLTSPVRDSEPVQPIASDTTIAPSQNNNPGNSKKHQSAGHALLRSSFNQLSEKITEIANEVHLMPFMDADHEKEYKELMVAQTGGEFVSGMTINDEEAP